MPLYEYRCADCLQVYEILHLGREERDDIVCPGCGSRRHVKMFSVAAVRSAGSGEPRCDAGSGECCGGACADSWK